MMNIIMQKAVNWYTGANIVPIHEAKQILEAQNEENESDKDEEEKNEEEALNNQCFEAVGTVTTLCERYGVIDKDLYFEHSNMLNISIGSKLSYLAYKKDAGIKISKILSINDDDWDATVCSPRPFHERTIPGQVTGRNGRLVVVQTKNEKHEIDLNKIETEFIPLVGDWVQLDATVEVDVNVLDLEGRVLEVIKISPNRTRVEGKAVVTNYDDATEMGVINNDVSFSKNSCTPGYLPAKNDAVTFEAIESTQGIQVWRALKVLPLNKTKLFYKVHDDNDTELIKNKKGIMVSDNIAVAVHKIGERAAFTIDVTNNGPDIQTIITCCFKSKDSQLALKKPNLQSSIEIRSNQTIVLVLSLEARFMGVTKELFVINFEGFKIGRWIAIQVAPPHDRKDRNSFRNYNNNKNSYVSQQMRDSILNARVNIVSGEKPMKTPAFVAIKLPMYHIPEKIADIFFNQVEVKQSFMNIPGEIISKSLVLDLSYKTYMDRFHSLLYLEEICIKLSMRRYDMKKGCFIHHGEFLILEVKDLSERRPSIIVGDHLIATDPNDSTGQQYEGYVHKTGAKHVSLKFSSAFHQSYKGEDYSIEFYCSRTNFRRFHQAIDLAYSHLGRTFLFPTSVPMKPAQVVFEVDDYSQSNIYSPNTSLDSSSENNTDPTERKYKSKILRLAHRMHQKRIKDDDNKSETSSTSDESLKQEPKLLPTQSESSETETAPTLLKLEWFDNKLNKFQKAAVTNILKGEARPLPYLIFGPPGTGKTVTLIETILQILRMIPHSRLLVTAPSNSAADLIAIRLIDSGVLRPGDLVRMVAYSRIADDKIPDKLKPYSVTGDISREGTREVQNLKENGVTLNAQLSTLGRHRITVATCMVVGMLYNMGTVKSHFTHIVVDEAAQALEPEIMIPFSLLDVNSAQAIMAGDPLQLGPYVFSMLSKQYGLGESFFERLINRFPYVRDPTGFPESGGYDPRLVTRLVFNYRSLPEILYLPNKLFYNAELIPLVSTDDGAEVNILKRIRDLLPKTNNRLPPAFVFHGVRGENYQTPDCPSWFNIVEAGQVFYYLTSLYEKGINPKDIGIITPYLKQCHQIRSLLNESDMELPKVGSVEEFQGQEFKIIILSTVRSNQSDARNDAKLGLGFISSPPRLNVAITRAQSLLIIIGNPHLLVMDSYWRSVLIYAYEIGGYIGCDFPNIMKNNK